MRGNVTPYGATVLQYVVAYREPRSPDVFAGGGLNSAEKRVNVAYGDMGVLLRFAYAAGLRI